MQNKIVINIDGKEMLVQAEIIEKKIWFKLEEQIYSCDIVDLQASGFQKSKSSAKSSDRIMAPMPGKVTKIFVTDNQRISKGDTLLVMEAMKMEYTLKADIEALVEAINCKVGDQVILGQLLVKLKESKKEV